MKATRLAFLKEIVKAIDYDIYKQLFEFPEEPETAADELANLDKIVARYEKKLKNEQ